MLRSAHLGNKIAGRLALAIAGLLIFFGLLEHTLRFIGYTHTPRQKILWKPVISGYIGTLAFDIPTRFVPPGYLWVAEPNTLLTDANGFRKPELPIKKEIGKYRIAFLGGSTTQGARRPYPDRTIALLNEALGSNRYEALNVACSSYTTHQSLKALAQWVLPRNPDLVVIYHGWNDVDVAGDGYADHEKDLAATRQLTRISSKVDLTRTRSAQLLAHILEQFDTTWPRMRVPPARFQQNLDQMLRMTQKKGIRTIVFSRPIARSRPPPPITPLAEIAYQKVGFPIDSPERALAMHQTITTIQHRVVSHSPHAELFDASHILDQIQRQHAEGFFGSDIQIFMADNLHIFEFAEERLAIELACSIAPEIAERIRTYTASPRYHLLRAHDFLQDDQAFEAAWHARECLHAAGGHHAEAQELLRRAEAAFEFVRLFRDARWGGPDHDYESRINKLKKCLELRPSDFGVCLQIYRVSEYAGRLADAASAMSVFKPANDQIAYEWMKLMMNACKAGRQMQAAADFAQKILVLRPHDPTAEAVLSEFSSP